MITWWIPDLFTKHIWKKKRQKAWFPGGLDLRSPTGSAGDSWRPAPRPACAPRGERRHLQGALCGASDVRGAARNHTGRLKTAKSSRTKMISLKSLHFFFETFCKFHFLSSWSCWHTSRILLGRILSIWPSRKRPVPRIGWLTTGNWWIFCVGWQSWSEPVEFAARFFEPPHGLAHSHCASDQGNTRILYTVKALARWQESIYILWHLTTSNYECRLVIFQTLILGMPGRQSVDSQ